MSRNNGFNNREIKIRKVFDKLTDNFGVIDCSYEHECYLIHRGIKKGAGNPHNKWCKLCIKIHGKYNEKTR